MNKIQVTTVKVDTQVFLPNTYFITKAVKAMLANDRLIANFERLEKAGQKVEPELSETLKTTSDFLHEIIDALEGNKPQ